VPALTGGGRGGGGRQPSCSGPDPFGACVLELTEAECAGVVLNRDDGAPPLFDPASDPSGTARDMNWTSGGCAVQARTRTRTPHPAPRPAWRRSPRPLPRRAGSGDHAA
jgi:hypothetical protein